MRQFLRDVEALTNNLPADDGDRLKKAVSDFQMQHVANLRALAAAATSVGAALTCSPDGRRLYEILRQAVHRMH